MPRPCTFFMMLKATAHWRVLDSDAQDDAFDTALSTVFNGYPELRLSRFNVGAFHGRCTHLLLWELAEGADIWQYEAAVESLHAQDFFSRPLFEIVEVIAGIEPQASEACPSVLEGCVL